MADYSKKFIYYLSDPRDGSIHWVGQAMDCQHRLKSHVHDAWKSPRNAELCTWLRGLALADVRPEVGVLEVVPFLEGNDAERRWIVKLRGLGYPLANMLPASREEVTRRQRDAKRNGLPVMSAAMCRQRRMKMRLSMKDVSAKTGYSESAISRYENGKRRVTEAYMNALQEALTEFRKEGRKRRELERKGGGK